MASHTVLIGYGDTGNKSVTVLPGSQVLRFILPGHVLEDPSLARVYDERGGVGACVTKLKGRTVKELLPPREKRHELAAAGDQA